MHAYTISFTTAGIQSLLSDIDPNKAQGPDKITPFTLKNCALENAPVQLQFVVTELRNPTFSLAYCKYLSCVQEGKP